MWTVLLPTGDNPIAVKQYIIIFVYCLLLMTAAVLCVWGGGTNLVCVRQTDVCTIVNNYA